MAEYGRIHTDGSRSGGQPIQSDVEQVARALAQADGIEICSDATYALSSYGHKAQAALAAMRQPTQSDALKVARDALEGMVKYSGMRESWQDNNPQYVEAADEAIDVIDAALGQSK